MIGCCPTPKRFSYSVPQVIAPNAMKVNSRPSADVASTAERATITSAAPASPSPRPIQFIPLTRSPTRCGTASATRIGCSDVISATLPAETPMRSARYVMLKYNA